MNTDKPTLDQVITYLTHRLDGMTMPGAVRMTTAARDYLVELQAENEKLRAELKQVKRERDAAVEQLHGICESCVHYTPYHNRGECASCEHEIVRDKKITPSDNWEWRGQKKD